MKNKFLGKIPILRNLDCAHICAMNSRALDTDLTAGQRNGMRFHYAICKVCRQSKEIFFNIHAALGSILKHFDFSTYKPLSDEQKQRLCLCIEKNKPTNSPTNTNENKP